MRDLFDSAPALRLGDSKAKPREIGILPNAEIFAVEAPKTDTAIPRPPSLAPEFGDAFGAAFSKPRDRLVPAKPAEGERRAYTFADVDFYIDEFATVSRETLAAVLGNVAHETRRPVGDGAMRYEPRGFVEIRPEVISEAEFKRRGDREPQIDHGDTLAASLVANHETLVRKAPK